MRTRASTVGMTRADFGSDIRPRQLPQYALIKRSIAKEMALHTPGHFSWPWPSSIHRLKELGVDFCVAQLIEQKIDSVHRPHRIKDAA